jgi:hypothetical protein
VKIVGELLANCESGNDTVILSLWIPQMMFIQKLQLDDGQKIFDKEELGGE